MRNGVRKVLAAACAVALASGLVPAGSAFPADDLAAGTAATLGGDSADDRIIVVYREGGPGLSAQAVEEAVSGADEELLTADAGAGVGAATVVSLPEGVSADEAIAIAEANPAVAYAQRNHRYYLPEDSSVMANDAGEGGFSVIPGEMAQAPMNQLRRGSGRHAVGEILRFAQDDKGGQALVDDPAALVSEDTKNEPNQWWLYDVGAFDAWQYARAEGQVTVAVFDTGIALGHEDLAGNILASYAWDAYTSTPLVESPTSEEFGHGTHVAGIVAGVANNATGIAGVSFNARILPVRVFHQGTDYLGRPKAVAEDASIIRGFDYLLSDPDGDGRTVAEETNTRVVNMSLGGYEGEDLLLESKIRQAQDAGILSVAAAGNDGTSQASYPSDYEDVMSVTALNSDGTIAYFSDHNASKDIAAPGTRIYSTWWSGGYEWEDGTSMAAPVVSGCAALLWAYYPGLTVAQVKEALYSTADDLGAEGRDPYFGYGRVNPAAALRSLGLVSITPERGQMTCATSQQLIATADFDTGAHGWLWSVDDPAIASIGDTGILTALAPGVVRVSARDAVDEMARGSIDIEITALQLPGAVVATANGAARAVQVQWLAAEGAALYRIERAESQDGPFAALAEAQVEDSGGEDGAMAVYSDATARAGTRYWYRVVPIGVVGDTRIEGEASAPASALYIDKSGLRSAMTRANGLLRDVAVKQSEDGRAGTDGNPVYADERWVTPAARAALADAYVEAVSCYMSPSSSQAQVDVQATDLAQACDAFEKAIAPGRVARSDAADGSDGQQPNPAPNPGADGQGGGQGDAGAQPSPDARADGAFAMHRLYNPNSGEHFYTLEAAERDSLVQAGWRYEGEGWVAPKASGLPVYRLYNPNAGDHHYTTSVRERDWLRGVGWNYEGVGWFSDEAQGRPLYRLYNPNAVAGAHHYTTNAAERDNLVRLGWQYEGIGWYGV